MVSEYIKNFKKIAFTLLIYSIQSSANNLKINLKVEKYKLENGLTVLLLEDHTVPLISYHTWYKVGSRDEEPGVTGAAHMLEHMMFKGGKKYSGQDFDRLMNENGIIHNAFTSHDYTGFYQNLPSSKLEMVMDIEFDRMSHLAIRPEDLKSEREVVKEERRWRVDNSPIGLLMESSFATIFKIHSYRWPVIGYMKDIENYTSEKLRYFYDSYYGPNNAVLVLIGDFEISNVKKLVDKYYGALPSRPVPNRIINKDAAQTQQYNAWVRSNIQSTSFNVAFRGVPQSHSSMYALDLASWILGAGSSSRLHRRLVEKDQSALSVSAGHSAMKDDGVFYVYVSLKPGIKMEEPLNIVYNEIWQMRNKLVSAEELQKAKTLAQKATLESIMTLDGKAKSLAAAEILTGNFQTLFTDLEAYEAVTAEQIQKICFELLNTNQRSIIVLEPKAGAQ